MDAAFFSVAAKSEDLGPSNEVAVCLGHALLLQIRKPGRHFASYLDLSIRMKTG